ncbi:MAG: undecaprenyl-diphosphate phosphatase [Candidatus Magasanikbacteria bacterium]
MTFIQSIVLGIVQGLTEFLPVSSSAHLVFLPRFFAWGEHDIAFDIMLHFGTLFAVVFYFRKKLWQLILAFFNYKPDITPEVKSDKRLAWLIVFSIIPAGIVGFFFSDLIENTFRSSTFMAFNLIFWGLILYLADRFSKKQKNQKTLGNISWKNNFFIACAQALALIPGTSRSGITMTAGLFSKLDKSSAAEYSFLMSVPIIFIAGADSLVKLVKNGLGDLNIIILLTGFLFSMISGFLAISLFLKIIRKWDFTPFVVYRILIGLLILFLL